jgi:hypothetical protein
MKYIKRFDEQHVLSVKNPWAFLIVSGLKDVENRSWKTNYRGKLLIHSTQTPIKFNNYNELFTPDQIKELQDNNTNFNNLSNSAIIGEVDLINCIQNSDSIWAEYGQWHWIISNPNIYINPVLNVKGSLSIWKY